MDLIQLALQAEQENIELRGQVAILEPKAKGLDRIADCTNVLGIRESAKSLRLVKISWFNISLTTRLYIVTNTEKFRLIKNLLIKSLFTL